VSVGQSVQALALFGNVPPHVYTGATQILSQLYAVHLASSLIQAPAVHLYFFTSATHTLSCLLSRLMQLLVLQALSSVHHLDPSLQIHAQLKEPHSLDHGVEHCCVPAKIT
jgi:hypothetical protein